MLSNCKLVYSMREAPCCVWIWVLGGCACPASFFSSSLSFWLVAGCLGRHKRGDPPTWPEPCYNTCNQVCGDGQGIGEGVLIQNEGEPASLSLPVSPFVLFCVMCIGCSTFSGQSRKKSWGNTPRASHLAFGCSACVLSGWNGN